VNDDLRAFWLEGFRDYLALEAGHSPHTVENYQRDLRRLAEFVRSKASAARKNSLGLFRETSCSFSRI
jgi:site-specific recombinase XerD